MLTWPEWEDQTFTKGTITLAGLGMERFVGVYMGQVVIVGAKQAELSR